MAIISQDKYPSFDFSGSTNANVIGSSLLALVVPGTMPSSLVRAWQKPIFLNPVFL